LADESGEWTLAARGAVERDGMAVPWLFWFEIRNILIVNERRGRIEVADVERFVGKLPRLVGDVDDEPDSATVMKLARSHQLAVYDAAYLELVARRSLTLCTRDRQLITAAENAAIGLWIP
jgi:predicted nucleic acid-binding protein